MAKPYNFLPPNFETEEEATEMHATMLAIFSHGDCRSPAFERLKNCAAEAPCALAECPSCYRQFRARLYEETRCLDVEGERWTYFTVLYDSGLVVEQRLSSIDPATIARSAFELIHYCLPDDCAAIMAVQFLLNSEYGLPITGNIVCCIKFAIPPEFADVDVHKVMRSVAVNSGRMLRGEVDKLNYFDTMEKLCYVQTTINTDYYDFKPRKKDIRRPGFPKATDKIRAAAEWLLPYPVGIRFAFKNILLTAPADNPLKFRLIRMV